jgi:subtilisin family serine protease
VVAVGGVDRNGKHAAVSVTGPKMVISGPAVDMASTGAHHSYNQGTGTSPSTAITAGVVALIRAKYPQLSATEVIHRLTATATDKGPPGRDDQYGYGIVNPDAALTATIPGEHTSAGPSQAVTTPGAEPASAAPPTRKGNLAPVIVTAAVIALIVIAGVLGVVALRRSRQSTAGQPPTAPP